MQMRATYLILLSLCGASLAADVSAFYASGNCQGFNVKFTLTSNYCVTAWLNSFSVYTNTLFPGQWMVGFDIIDDPSFGEECHQAQCQVPGSGRCCEDTNRSKFIRGAQKFCCREKMTLEEANAARSNNTAPCVDALEAGGSFNAPLPHGGGYVEIPHSGGHFDETNIRAAIAVYLSGADLDGLVQETMSLIPQSHGGNRED